MRLLIHFARYGPYHHARLRAAHEVLTPMGWEVIGLEIAGTDSTYAWNESKAAADGPRVLTAFPGRVHEEITAPEYRKTLLPLLDSLKPDAMAIAGWGSTDAVMCLSWCRKHDARTIAMSETRAADGRRVWWKELAKRYLISRFDGALVGARSHLDYLVKLGMKPERIAFGYNVVDNAYFASETLKHRNTETPKHWPFFLSSNRFIERKNLSRLIEAYAAYVPRASSPTTDNRQATSSPWPLVLLGDGEQKPALIAQCHELGLNVKESAPWDSTKDQGPRTKDAPQAQSTVFFPGFRQIDELPRFYARAGCFIHPALEEPWGLVINEAMACGLPVLSGDNVGAAEELVDDGVNGWKFDVTDVELLADLMLRISAPDFSLSSYSEASRRILEERAPTAAFGKGLAGLLQR